MTARPGETMLLNVHALTVRHGGVVALDAVNLTVASGSISGLIGPNGAGKTTFIDAVSGFTPNDSGRITFADRQVEHLRPHDRVRLGLVRTFQSLELFDDLTVRENLSVAAVTPTWRSTVTDLFWPKSPQDDGSEVLLDTFGLTAHAHRSPSELSNGQRHLVVLARAVAARPKLVLLDEPAAGLDPGETKELATVLRRLPEMGTAVLLVEHDMSLVMGVCDTLHVLDFGRIIASGPPAELRADPLVIAAYLGQQSTDR
ncbi:MAG: ABC transporter ATP-binding protein [Aquihabitans sp.]